ncbi:MAG: DNA polymerase III subunit delta' [Deltaproteobacteria bacterium]|nr:DNA polymerase III subunit delta' [Deltaproteobacteria bacterium]
MESGKKIKPFSRIIGQGKAIGFLKRVIAGGKIPHALLFTGIEGVGKTTTALAFCQAINCLAPVNGEGCGRCRNCRQLVSGNFPDLKFIEPDGQYLKIEQIRELNRDICFRPVEGAYRVVVISRAEAMNQESANSFLKTLEEPPQGNVIILKVKEPRDLLPTIVSRCQKVPFSPLPRPAVRQYLTDEMGIDGENASLIAGLSGGSLGKAISMSSGDYLEERQKTIGDIIHLPGMSKPQAMGLGMEYAQDMKKRDNDSTGGIDLFELIGIWKTWYRDMIVIKAGGHADMLINADFSRKLKSISGHMTMDNLIQCFFHLDRAQMDLMKNPNTGLMMEDLFLGLLRQAHSPDGF